ncbi:APC family permease [Sphingomonas cavernae]|uniref:APC family permease n=1 Tax=Sphingomonas cavernae TaxID=2320861 RepID=A0A418WR00_9SPHN|nr:APC family permease [Sphingomonas cavernae]RJF93673.1 APC family permease [Sphingomonas cavernae]
MAAKQGFGRKRPGRSDRTASPRPSFGVREAVALTVGVVVGAGIYRTPPLVAAQSPDGEAMMLTWLLGGVISMIGALCYAELASTFPHAGGEYHFLRRAFGRRFAFLYGWSRLTIIQTGSLALLAYVYGDYASEILPLGRHSASIHAAAAVAAITAINWAGVTHGCRTQLWLTALELLGLGLVIVAGLLIAPKAVAAAPPPGETSLGLVLVFVLLTYGGWSESAYLSAELREARRRIMPVLIGSLALIMAIYLLVNLAYLRALGLAGTAGSHAVAADLLRRAWGPDAAAAISVAVAVAALTSANATAFTGARSAFALGRDFPRLAFLGRWRSEKGTPANALLVQGGAALLLVGFGAFARDGFRLAVEYTAPAFWLFFLAVGLALFVLRRREPEIERPFRVPLYPAIPALFCLTSAYLLYSSLAYTGVGALVGAVVVAAGALMLLFIDRRSVPLENAS